MNIAGFENIAKYLAIPLELVWFVLMLVFWLHKEIVNSGLLWQVNQKDIGLIIRLFFRYGFRLALTLLLASVGLSAWNSYMEKEKVQIQAVNAGKVAEQLYVQLDTKDQQLSTKDEQIKALTEAITALSKTGASAASINDSLQELEQGDTAKAQAIFAEVLRSKEAEGRKANKEAAAAARHLGALAYMNNPKEALAAYQKAVQLDPDDADGWTWLALLLYRTGKLDKAEEMHRKALARANQYTNQGIVYWRRKELDKAEEMYRKALELYKAWGRKEGMAANYANLGLVYQTREELDKAEEMYRKALALNEALGSKEGMAVNYTNLGNVAYTGEELDKAEEMHRKALTINEALGRKEYMAINYDNLGIVYWTGSNFAQAEAAWKQSLSLYQAMGAMQHPYAKKVQQWLDELAQKRAM